MGIRGILTRLALGLFGLVLGFLILELALQIASQVQPERKVASAGDGMEVILVVGDSHAWGAGRGVAERLAKRLSEYGDRYRVLNLGVPGSNTAQLRSYFDEYLDRFDPSTIVIWSGMNNNWNRGGTEHWFDEGLVDDRSFAERVLESSKVLRFLRVWRIQAEMREHLESRETYVMPETSAGPRRGRDFRRVSVHGADFEYRTVFSNGNRLPWDQTRDVTELDLTAMVDDASDRGIGVFLVTYPLPTAAGVAIERVAEATDAELIRVGAAVKRVRARADANGEPRPKMFTPSAHPTQTVYDETADMVVERMQERGWVSAP